MKKILFCLLISAGFFANAQTEKGTLLVGVGFGSMSYTNSESTTTYSNTPTEYNSDGNSFSISINPSVSWFIADNFALGGGVSASFYTSNSDSSNTGSTATSTSKSTQPAFYIGPMARYYFTKSTSGKPYVQGNFQIGISGGKSESETSTGASSETTTHPKGDWNAGVSFGYEYFISSYVGLYASVGFNYGSSKTEYEYRPSTGSGYDYTSEYSRFYIPVNVGLQVHLPCNKGKKEPKAE